MTHGGFWIGLKLLVDVQDIGTANLAWPRGRTMGGFTATAPLVGGFRKKATFLDRLGLVHRCM